MGFDLFKSKKDKAVGRVLDTTKDNVTRIRALDLLEELAQSGDAEAIDTLLRCFHVTVKTDKQEQSLSPYDDEQEKHSLVDRLSGISTHRDLLLTALRRELASPPLLSPGRRDGIVWLIELLRRAAEAAAKDAAEAEDMVLEELVRALRRYDPEEMYRDPDRKSELIRAIGKIHSARASEAILPFVYDVDESVRFRAVDALGTAGDPSVAEKLGDVLLDDESLRIRQRAGEVLADIGGSIKGHARRKEIEAALPSDAVVDKQGTVKRRGA